MSNPVIQLVVLAAIAIFLILRLRNVLGTREGFEQPPQAENSPAEQRKRFEVIENIPDGPDQDIIDHVEEGTPAALALAKMKEVEPSFHVGQFLSGSKSAYEMILMAFERGDLTEVRPFLSEEVAQAFQSVIDDRAARGLTVKAQFLGTREVILAGADFDEQSGEGEVSVRFTGELIAATMDADGKVIEGDSRTPRKQRDIWTFGREMGQDDPNWRLVATS